MNDGSYQAIIENLHDGLYFVDQNRIITYWNKSAEKISGFSAEEVIGKSCADNILTHVDENGNNLCQGLCPLANSMKTGEPVENKIYMHHKFGQRVPVSVRVNPMKDENGEIIGAVELFTDISNQEANELRVKELEKLAFLDQLTELANRTYLEQELNRCFAEQKELGVDFGVFFIDIDHFKQFNDTYGHDVGDKVLQIVARTLTANARAFDLYGRWGGEEFIGIIRNINAENLEKLGNRIRFLVEKSYIIQDNYKLQVTISIGGTVAKKGDDGKQIIKRADKLLYESKKNGRNQITMG